jgi:AraC-like DNA-binding protein
MPALSFSQNLLLLVSGLGTLQGILLASVIYHHPKSDRRVNKFLALYILCICIVMAGPLVLWLAPWQVNMAIQPFTILAGPLLYLYIRSTKQPLSWKKALSHLAVFLFYLVFVTGWTIKASNENPGAPAMPASVIQSPIILVLLAVRYIHFFLYYAFSRKALVSYRRSVDTLLSPTGKADINWLRLLTNGYLILVVISFVTLLVMVTYPQQSYLLYITTIAFATPYIYISTYKSLQRPGIWQMAVVPPVDSENIEKPIVSIQSVSRPGMSDDRKEEIVAKLIAVMEKDKLYQETELTLQDLSETLCFPTHQVSQAINEGLKKSFYDLVNSYRVEEAKRLLLNPKNTNYTILSVGFEAGFNSKTTFNTVFKKFTGQTPTEYRDKNTKLEVA